MAVWLTIPSARPVEEAEKVLKLWRERGYKIALMVDTPEDGAAKNHMANLIMSSPDGYRGYARSVNALVAFLLKEAQSAEWFIIGGDDVEPDPNHTAEEIARQEFERSRTFGVMQPVGDRFASVHGVAMIEKVAGSAWIGREFARRMYGGKGPLWPGYFRYFMDQELQDVATKYGVFQQRRDLIHLHRHYMRENEDINSPAVAAEVPAHLKAQETLWNPEKKMFYERQRNGFPGSEPIP